MENTEQEIKIEISLTQNDMKRSEHHKNVLRKGIAAFKNEIFQQLFPSPHGAAMAGHKL